VLRVAKSICEYLCPFVFQSLGPVGSEDGEERGVGGCATQAGRAVPHTAESICPAPAGFVSIGVPEVLVWED
jgi:hypothetical protein